MMDLFEKGFPAELWDDVFLVEKYLPTKTYRSVSMGQSEERCVYALQGGQTVSFPDRIYYIEAAAEGFSLFTQTQKNIYHAIYSRSCDGFVREKHIKSLLDNGPEEWTYPYILKLSDEYVIEIVELLYRELRLRDTGP